MKNQCMLLQTRQDYLVRQQCFMKIIFTTCLSKLIQISTFYLHQYNEVIAISDKFGDADELADMVYEVNMEQVSIEERLSNQVYHYDKEARTLRLATDKFDRKISDDIQDKTHQIEEGKAR